MSEAKLPKPVDHSMAHHLVTYAANNMIAPLVHAQIARDEYEELERQYQETVSDLSISATLVRNRTQEAESLRAENERLRADLRSSQDECAMLRHQRDEALQENSRLSDSFGRAAYCHGDHEGPCFPACTRERAE